MSTPRRIVALIAAALAATTVVSACSSDSGSSDNAGSGSTTLIVGDQVKQTQSLLEASGELKDLPYKITWAAFESGPPLLEAASAGKIDVGGTGDVPPVFAQAGGAKVKIVGVQQRTKANDFLLVPAGSSAKSIADLKGKRIGVAKGSSSHGLLLGLLAQAGLKPTDVKATFLQPSEALSAFTAGQLDAWAVWNPFATVARTQAKAQVIADGTEVTTGQSYTLASDTALGNAAKKKAIADYLARLGRAQKWAVDHASQWVPTYSKLTKLSQPVAEATFATTQGQLVPIGTTQIDKHQKLIDLFYNGGQLPTAPKAADVFDNEFNTSVSTS
ncbi:ABC transporter substrate-binding protein [Williamsia sp. CHRR-6]|uniref:ABC transporter substrate-binding protein n=1 Tax=Williamsia sp. CHRR-6 TaxID=2835871 RepID=UPI0027DC87FD|nr:ABC transporter substrate-binding protein [Williamsia sp. CHRR-6]